MSTLVEVTVKEFIIVVLALLTAGAGIGYVIAEWIHRDPIFFIEDDGNGGTEFPPGPQPIIPDSPMDIDWTFQMGPH